MAHQGPGKGAQPRTFRSNALSKVDSKNLSDTVGYDAQGGHPVTSEIPMSVYHDTAEQAQLGSLGKTSQGITPFSNLKGGK